MTYAKQQVPGLHDPLTGALVGLMGADGREYRLPAVDPAWLTFQDASGAPGGATINSDRGRAAFATGTSSVVITNSLCTPSSVVRAQLDTADATLTQILTVAPGSGSFTVNGNANATGTPAFRFALFN